MLSAEEAECCERLLCKEWPFLFKGHRRGAKKQTGRRGDGEARSIISFACTML